MNQRYTIDTTALMSYFSKTFDIECIISDKGIEIINKAFESNTIILFIPSIVFVEIFSKKFVSSEIAARIRFELYEKINSCNNISIEAIDQEVLECFIRITDIEKEYNFDNHDKIIYATAMKFQAPLITSDLRLIRYNKRKKLVPDIIP